MARKKPAAAPAPPGPDSFAPVLIDLDQLKPHPRNYREHPEDQLDHIVASIKAHGFYRNVVVANDLTVLAGHGVVLASKKMGLTSIPVIQLPIGPDDPRALSVLTGDNEIGSLASVNDRILTELLRELNHTELGLLGTGFNAEQLTALAMVTRPVSELANKAEASEWLGMPEYGEPVEVHKLTISFATAADRLRYVEETGLKIDKRQGGHWSTPWPYRERLDLASARFEG